MSISLMAQKEVCLKKRYKLEEVYGIYEIITHTVDDLPDASKTNAMYKRGLWG